MSTTTLQTQVVTEGREALSRATRQAIQALIPTLLVVAGGSTSGINVAAVATLAAVTALVSVLSSAAGFKLGTEAPDWARIAERAVKAAAGTALGLVTVDGVVPAASIHWQALFTASVGAAVLAVAMFSTNPPVVAEDDEDDLASPFPQTTFDPDSESRPGDRGGIDVLTVLLVFVLVGVVLMLFGVDFS